ncbi:hypothetical protein KY289_005017 [Solanum tuberosum]|nr:hypothetical protein KY289_005017 [Solanum tuberosum]
MTGTTTGGDLPLVDFPPLPTQKKPDTQPFTNPIQYANLLKPKPITPPKLIVPPKPVIILHGEPSITWKTSEVKSLIIQEKLQYAIVGKFSFGNPDVNELRRTIPR